MSRSQDYIQQNKSAIFDWLVFSFSFSMGFIFPTLKEFVVSPGFSFWMFIALLLYISGAALKHLPIRYRLNSKGRHVKEFPLFIFLLVGHFFIFVVVVISSSSAILKIFGSTPSAFKISEDTNILIIILTAIFITWLIFRPKREVRGQKNISQKTLFWMEMVADLLLVAGVSILSFAFWEKGLFSIMTYRPVSSINDIWVLFVFLSITYVFFYLPLRYLFLIEDYTAKGTWKRLLLIFALLLLKSLFEII